MLQYIISSISLAFAGISVIWAIVLYRRQHDERVFLEVRSSLVTLRQSVHEWDVLLGDPIFVEIGATITSELSKLFSTKASKKEIRNFILDENDDFVAQAVDMGRRKSTGFRECERLAWPGMHSDSCSPMGRGLS